MEQMKNIEEFNALMGYDSISEELEMLQTIFKETYGKKGENIDLNKLPNGNYRSMVTHYAWHSMVVGYKIGYETHK